MKKLIMLLILVLMLSACGDDGSSEDSDYSIQFICSDDANVGIWIADSGNFANKTDITLLIREMTEQEFAEFCKGQ